MKTHKKAKPARKAATRKAHAHPTRSGARSAKAARPKRTQAKRTRAASREPQAHYKAALQGIQDAVASLADQDLIDILSDLSWSSRAKWLSSYFADQAPDEAVADGDGAADAIDDIGAQIAALLTALDAGQPTNFLHAVTCCFSADPEHVAAGETWLRDHLGTTEIDVDALEGLPGYQAVAEIMARIGEGSDAAA